MSEKGSESSGPRDPFAPFAGLASRCIHNPRRLVAVALLLLVAAVPGLFRLHLRTDGHALVPPDDPAVSLDAEIREHFQLRDPIIVLITSDDEHGIFNAGTLAQVRELTSDLSRLEGIGRRNVMSLATEKRDRVRPGTLAFREFLDTVPASPAEMRTLRSDVEAAEILTGTLVSADERSTAIFVGMPNDAGSARRIAVYREIHEIVDRASRPGDSVIVVGAPVAEALLGYHILADLKVLLPLALAVMALVVWIGCRRPWGVALAFLEVVGCLILTFGLMGWLGIPIYLTTAVLPVILTTIGVAGEIHVFWHYRQVVRAGRASPGPAAAELTMRELVRPIVLSSLTTAIGLLAYPFSSIEPVRMFGLFAALGTALCMLWTLTCTPAALARIPAARMAPRPRRRGARHAGVLGLVRMPLAVTIAMVLATTVASLGLLRLHVQDSWVGGFAKDSSFRRDIDRVNRQLLGMHLLLVHLRFDRLDAGPAPLHRPGVLEAIGRLEGFIRSRTEVGGVLGPYAHLRAVSYLWGGRRDSARALPHDPRGVEALLGTFERGRGVHRRREIIDDAAERAIVTVFLGEANYRDTARLTGEIRSYVDRRLRGLGASVDFAGDVAVSQATIPAIVDTQITSLGLALLGSFLAVSLFARSWQLGFVTIVPASVSVLWVLGAMGWIGVPIGIASSMFCAISLGIGVDYAIHLVEALRRAARAGSDAPTRSALCEVGPAIVIDTLAVSLGFGLLTLSRVPADAVLGMLAASALVAGCLLTMAGLGSLAAMAERFGPARALLFEE